ncbi:MAG: hypothetical protein EPN91_03615 [Salinibacterium sp.]|nr:MAG: hypothetical protein EPN91_03615 [Salinibacterium sp.]
MAEHQRLAAETTVLLREVTVWASKLPAPDAEVHRRDMYERALAVRSAATPEEAATAFYRSDAPAIDEAIKSAFREQFGERLTSLLQQYEDLGLEGTLGGGPSSATVWLIAETFPTMPEMLAQHLGALRDQL